jgi:hypothetical protein
MIKQLTFTIFALTSMSASAMCYMPPSGSGQAGVQAYMDCLDRDQSMQSQNRLNYQTENTINYLNSQSATGVINPSNGQITHPSPYLPYQPYNNNGYR